MMAQGIKFALAIVVRMRWWLHARRAHGPRCCGQRHGRGAYPCVGERATWLVQDEVDRGDLVPILPALTTEGLPLNLVWPIRWQLLSKVDAVLELLSAELRIS